MHFFRTQNPKGYTIPLDKRLAADGRGLQEVQINDNFAKLSEVKSDIQSLTLLELHNKARVGTRCPLHLLRLFVFLAGSVSC